MKTFNNTCRDMFRSVLRNSLQAKALCTGQKFSCRALNGQSSYNICINCDMTVSCNCKDNYGEGHIGDLSRQSLQEIFDGPVAAGFRLKLSRGVLPISICATCPELQMVSGEAAARALTSYSVPSNGIMVENTVLCNLDCIGCPSRELRGRRNKTSLTLVDLERIAAELSKHRVKHVSYFNLGEPFLSVRLREELQILRRLNPGIRILLSTNGLGLDDDEARETAMLLDHIIFSIDGVDDGMVRRYQNNGSFFKSFSNMSKLVKFRDDRKANVPIVEWRYILFRWNDRRKDLEKAIELGRMCGCNKITFLPTLRPVWGISLKYWLGSFSGLGRRVGSGFEIDLAR